MGSGRPLRSLMVHQAYDAAALLSSAQQEFDGAGCQTDVNAKTRGMAGENESHKNNTIWLQMSTGVDRQPKSTRARVRKEANRPHNRSSDSTSPIIHTALSHSSSIIGSIRIFFFIELVWDWQLSTFTDTQGSRRLQRSKGGPRLIDCLPAGWWLALEKE